MMSGTLSDLWRRLGNRRSRSSVLANPPIRPPEAARAEPEKPTRAANELVFLDPSAKEFDLEYFLRGSAEVLGKGTMGTSYKAVLEDGTTVIVKRLRDVAFPEGKFRKTMNALGAMRHENLLPLMAYHYSRDDKILIFDYMPLGSLYGLLHGGVGSEKTRLSWEIRHGIALGAARAIEYLHAQGPNVFHGKIKSTNVLLTASYDPLVSDYGLTSIQGPPNGASKAADLQKDDVYSFGVLLVELLTGKPDGADLVHLFRSTTGEHWTVDDFDHVLGEYQNFQDELVGLMQVAMACASDLRQRRPSMSKVRRMIEDRQPQPLPEQIIEVNNDLSERTRRSRASVSANPPIRPLGAARAEPEKPTSTANELVFLDPSTKEFDFEHLLRASLEILGKGTVGTSCKAILENGKTVVVKRLRDVALPVGKFKKTMNALGAMRHENLLPLMAYCYGRYDYGQLLIFDYMPLGSLYGLLHGGVGSEKTRLSWEIRHGIALGAARAIEYLHAQGPNVFHGKIKSTNVLLTASYDPLVSDYSLTSIQAPPVGASKAADPQKDDVYSFGVLLVELLTGKPDGADLACLVKPTTGRHWTVYDFDPEPGEYQNFQDELVGLMQVAMACASDLRQRRPSMSEVRRMIEDRQSQPLPEQIIEVNDDLSERTRNLPNGGVLEVANRVYGVREYFNNRGVSGKPSPEENEVPELPVQSNTESTSTLPPTLPSPSETSVQSALEGSFGTFELATKSPYISPSVDLDQQCGYIVQGNGQSSSLSDFTGLSSSSSVQSKTSLLASPPATSLQPPPPPRSKGTPPSSTANDSPQASSIPAPPLPPPSPSVAQVEQMMSSSELSQDEITTRNIVEPAKMQALKLQPLLSLEKPYVVISGENTESLKWEEGIEAVTETKTGGTSVIDSTFSSAINNGSLATITKSTFMTSGYDYDVFLSFRGPDTRLGIIDSLYMSLIDAGIHTFKDNEELRVGEEFGPELLKAIRHSKIAIPIFSEGYASSKWCLKELVEMVKCKERRRQKIMPIFYHVTPAEVRHQTGSYKKAFDMHKEKVQGNVISEWKAALKDVANLMGWDIMIIRHQGQLVRMVVQKVMDELKTAHLLVPDCLVGVENHVKKIEAMMCDDSEDIRILGIHGMGGVGKTTLAKIIYNQLSYRFEDCCFLSNVRETVQLEGIKCLQKQLLSDILKRNWPNISNGDDGIKVIKERLCGKKVLLLLDDINEKSQLDELMASPVCFGLGSRIIITCRNTGVLNVPEACCPYELTGLDFKQSLQLFCKHAFGRDHPLDEYAAFSSEVVKITGGLPLALKVIGSLPLDRSKDFWDDTLKKLEKVPREEVKRALKISFEALDGRQKQIFLDIACLFIGFDKRVVFHIWNDSNLFPVEGLQTLEQMSLIKIGKDNKLSMHNQLRLFGRDIVHQECNMQLEKQTILWNPEEALEVVIGKKGTEHTKALCLEFDHHLQQYFTNEEFGRLSNLRYLEMRPVQDNWPTSGFLTNSFPTNPPILSELRWLSWHNFPPVLTLTTFSMMKMVILDLSWSKFTESWDGWSHIKMARNLKVLNLTGCAHMHKTPELSSNINLEQLILESCGSLVQIDESIGQLTQLILLNLRFCHKLCQLPEEMANLESLKELLIDCTSIREVPGLSVNDCSSIGNSTSLSRLFLENVEVSQPPVEISVLVKLEHLSLSGCKLLKKIPESIWNLESLVELNLSHTHIAELPKSLGNLKNLKILRMCGSSIRSIPSAIGMLEKLKEIDAEFCQCLEGTIPEDIGRLSSLEILNFSSSRICNIPKLPESLLSLHIGTNSMKTLPDLSNLINLIELNLEISQVPEFCLAEEDSTLVDTIELGRDPSPRWIGNLCNLESLKLSCDNMTVLHGDIGLLSELKRLEILCFNLQILPRLPSSLLCLLIKSSRSLETSIDLSNFKELSELRIYSSVITDVHGLESLKNLQTLDLRALNIHERLLNLSDLKKLNELHLGHCRNLIDLQSIQSLGNLRILKLIDILQLEKLPNLSNLKKLTELHLLQCRSLTEIQSFEGLEKLIVLKLGELPLLDRLPDLSNLKKLTILDLQQCHNLVKIQGRLDSLEDLCIYGCNSLVELPDPSSFKNLKSLQLRDCEMLQIDQVWVSKSDTFDTVFGSPRCSMMRRLGICVCQLGRHFISCFLKM